MFDVELGTFEEDESDVEVDRLYCVGNLVLALVLAGYCDVTLDVETVEDGVTEDDFELDLEEAITLDVVGTLMTT